MEKIKISPVCLRGTDFKIYTKHEFFKEPVKVTIEHNKIIFNHITIDDNKYFTPSKNGSLLAIQVQSDYLEEGEYEIDQEESDEDQLVVYFEDKIIET